MSDNSGVMVECPTCHLEVSAQARCELCGSPLPELAADEESTIAPQTHDSSKTENDTEQGRKDQAAPPNQEPSQSKPEETSQDNSSNEPIPPEEDSVDKSDHYTSSIDETIFVDSEGQASKEDPKESLSDDDHQSFDQNANQTKDRGGGTSYTPFKPINNKTINQQELFKRLFTDFQFEGRMARTPYWTMFAWRFGVGVLCGLFIEAEPEVLGPIAFLVVLVVSISGLAEACRRLHDTGRSGWFNLLVLVPYIGFIGLIVLLAFDGTEGDNQFGPVPTENS